jgi:hypothetical protein
MVFDSEVVKLKTRIEEVQVQLRSMKNNVPSEVAPSQGSALDSLQKIMQTRFG